MRLSGVLYGESGAKFSIFLNAGVIVSLILRRGPRYHPPLAVFSSSLQKGVDTLSITTVLIIMRKTIGIYLRLSNFIPRCSVQFGCYLT